MATTGRKPKPKVTDHPETSADGQAAKAEAEQNAPAAAELRSIMERHQELGYVGSKVDPVPNENYTVTGQFSAAQDESQSESE